MDAPLSLTLLYTAGIAGDLAQLPRLHTFLQRLKPGDARNTLLLDLGGSCSQAIWHCRATGNRSALIVLDGMGYHAATVEGTLDAGNRAKLAAQVTLALVDRQNEWRFTLPSADDGGIVATMRPRESSARLQIMLKLSESTCLERRVLRFQGVCAGQVGEVVVDMRGEPALVSSCIHVMPADTPPNPSIAGAVEFVESEARFFVQKYGGQMP